MKVEIFKTNINKKKVAENIIANIQQQFTDYKVNFDLEDCDKILRIEAEKINAKRIIELVKNTGHCCQRIV